MSAITAIFDISSDAIRLTLTERSGNRPKLLKAELFPIGGKELRPVFNVEHVEQLRRAHAAIPHEYVHVAKVVCVLHAPFAVTHLRAAGRTFPEPVFVTPEVLDAVLDNGAESFKPQGLYIRTERVALLVKLNGYPVLKPFGKKAHEITVTVYESYITEEVRQKVVSVIGNTTLRDGAGFRTVALSALPVVRDILHKGSDMTLIHAGVLSTDVGIVRGGMLSGLRTFGEGSRAFALELCERITPEYSEAESLVKLCLDGALSSDTKMVVEGIREDVRYRWLSQLVGSDRPDTSTMLMPRHAVLFGDPLGVKLYGGLLSTEGSRRGVLEGMIFESDTLSPQALLPFVEVSSSLAPDIYHLISALSFK